MKVSTVRLINGAVNFVVGLIVLGLFTRLILRLFGANPETPFVEFVYSSTANLLDPFRNIFSPYIIETGNVFEFSTLFAIIIYVIFGWLLTELLIFIAGSIQQNKTK